MDLWLMGKIEAIHRRSRGVYGSPNIHAELANDHGIRVGRKRVARLMRAAGLRERAHHRPASHAKIRSEWRAVP
jgi:putative transposase